MSAFGTHEYKEHLMNFIVSSSMGGQRAHIPGKFHENE